MENLERNSETWKTPGFLGFECRISIFGFGKRKGQVFTPGVGFRVQVPITTSPTMIFYHATP